MRDKVLVATASVLVIAFSISLLNIYIFPNIRFQLEEERNYTNEEQLALLLNQENIAMSSSFFEEINLSYIIHDIPEHSIMNISYMLEQVKSHQSAAYDTLVNVYYETEETIPQPQSIKMSYNGTIAFVGDDVSKYITKLNSFYKGEGKNATYFVVSNSSSYITKCNISTVGLEKFNLEEAVTKLTNLFADTNTKPFYLVYQHVTYEESRGLLLTYSTSFTRMIFLNVFGDLQFFISSEGYWIKPLDLLLQ